MANHYNYIHIHNNLFVLDLKHGTSKSTYNLQHSINLNIEYVFSAEFILLDTNDDFEQTDFTTDFKFRNYKLYTIKGHLLLDISAAYSESNLVAKIFRIHMAEFDLEDKLPL